MENNIIVSESSKVLRALGRDALTGKWGLAALGTLLYTALIFIPAIIIMIIFGLESTTTSTVTNIYSVLISGPLTLGYTMFIISIFRKRETSAAEVFYGFEKFGKALGLYLVMTIFILLWMILFIIPGIIAAYRYSMAFFILADNPEIGIMDAIRQSKQMMAGNKWKYFCLNLSFIGWALLCIPTLGIGTLWLSPYMQSSVTAFYEIARGSLKSVNSLEGNIVNPIEEQAKTEDPITIYKDEENTKDEE